MRRLIDGFQSTALLVLGAVTFVYFGPLVDRLFPVVEPFVITSKEIKKDTILISGWLYKKREACEFISAQGLVKRSEGAPITVPFEFLDTKQVYSRPGGLQTWGPWSIVVPKDAEKVTITALHSCHPFWKTRSELEIIELHNNSNEGDI